MRSSEDKLLSNNETTRTKELAEADTRQGLILRCATVSDASQIQAIYGPFCTNESAVSFEIVSPSVEEMAERIRKVQENLPWLVATDGPTILGYVYASEHKQRAAYRWSVDTAIYLHRDARGKGIGKAMYQSLFALLRLQRYVNACAGVTLPNPASVQLHLSSGFKQVGVFHQIGYKSGAWHDVAQFEMSLVPHQTEPPPPRRFEEIVRTSQAGAILGQPLAIL
jgi:phosphinothricin acetyltransferase